MTEQEPQIVLGITGALVSLCSFIAGFVTGWWLRDRRSNCPTVSGEIQRLRTLEQRAEQAERERDAALERVKELEGK